jgi:hypothetical protein
MSDPKNKWTRPGAPPAPMFFGEKERNLVKQVNDELAERVLGQTIAYYPISLEDSNFNDIYGEAKEKVTLPPVRVFAYVEVTNDQTNTKYGYEYQTKLTVNFHRRRLVEDQNLYVRVGDFVQYGDVFYEIVKTFNDTRYYFGQVEHKFQISAECVRARDGAFRILPEVDRPTLKQEEETDISSPAPRPVPYPPLTATYITVNPETKLPNERVLTAGTGITIADSGAGGAITITSTVAGAAGPTGSLQFQQGGGSFTGSANLTFLSSSGRLGINTDTPTNSLTIIGDFSASSDAYFGNDVYIAGTLYGGSPLKIAGAIQIHDVTNGGGVVASFGDVSSDGSVKVSASCGLFTDVTASAHVSASLYYGDGRYLTNVARAQGGMGYLQYYSSNDGKISGSSNLQYLTSSNTLSVVGNVSASSNISSSYFYGDGRYLTNVTASAITTGDGPIGSLQFRVDNPIANEISGTANVLYDLTNNSFKVDSGLSHNRVSVLSSYTASAGNYILGVSAVPSSILFNAADFSSGQVLVVKDESGLASSNDAITLNPSGSQTIDGAPAVYVESPYGSVILYTDGSDWYIY